MKAVPSLSEREAEAALPGRRALLVGAGVIAVAIATRFSSAVPTTDYVSEAERERRRVALLAALPLKLAGVPQAEAETAIRALALPNEQQQSLLQSVQSGQTQLAWLELFDSDAEDGDAVAAESLGLTIIVPLRHAPTRIAIPVPPSGQLRITGFNEGSGGGVTAGVISNGQQLKMPPMKKGQTYTLRISVS